MKRLKGLLILATILLTGLTYAQPGGGGGGGQQGGQQGEQQGPPPVPTAKEITKMVNEIATSISLTDVQKTAVSKLYTEHFAAVKEKTSGSSRPKREEMEALKTDLETKVKALLTEEQQKGYITYLKKNSKKEPSR